MAKTETIVLGGGCFWCLEALLKTITGVSRAAPGYAGGTVDNPTYESVSTGKTGHAEVVKVEFDPDQISLPDLLAVFFEIHDPTTLNRQGNDVGTQYRSIILYNHENQGTVVRRALAAAQTNFSAPIVTEVKKLDKFWPAENYHVDYFAKNKNQPYCRLVIAPKLAKLKETK